MLLVDLLKQHSIHCDLMQQIKQQEAKEIVFFSRRHITQHKEKRNGGGAIAQACLIQRCFVFTKLFARLKLEFYGLRSRAANSNAGQLPQ